MAQNSMKDGIPRLLEHAIDGISDPIILAGVVLGVALILNLPAIISASAEAIREGRKAKVEVEARRQILNSQIKSLEDKRLRKKRRGSGK